MSKSFWNNNHPLQDEYKRLRAELVPDEGPAETIRGEILRLAGNIYYDHHNNGGVNGFRKEAHALTHLLESQGQPADEWDRYADVVVRDHYLTHEEDAYWTPRLDDAVERIIEWLTATEPQPAQP